jgi:hypothetical protein
MPGMPKRTGAAYVVTTTRRYKDKLYRTHLLRRSYRVGQSVKNETLGNLSHLPEPLVDIIRRTLRGETFVPMQERFEILASRAHGHVQAVRTAIDQLGLPSVLASKPGRARELVLAMVIGRILAPHTKLATTRWWHTTTLAEELGVADADEDDLYAALDWLLSRQDAIQKKLAARHLHDGSLVLYDLSSSYFEGSTCALAKLGYNRDGKKGKLQVNYGLLTDRHGCPVALSVYAGNTADPSTLMPEVERLRTTFGLTRMVLVGDRGMLSQQSIETLKRHEGLAWITALKSVSIRVLIEQGHLQLDLFDERNLFEIAHPDYPAERLIACRNPQLAQLRAHKREALLQATEKALEQLRVRVARGRLQGKDQIGLSVGKVINQYKVAKHFQLAITDTALSFSRDPHSIGAEAALDGLYLIRSSVPAAQMDSAECVRSYKSLAEVERAFRSLKTVDLKVRPIHHRLPDRVRAHIFLCMLAYYVEWHLRECWRTLMFADEDVLLKRVRDPVAPAQRSAAALAKVAQRRTRAGAPAHSFQTLIAELATIVRNTCRAPGAAPDAPTFQVTTTANATQRQALDLVAQMPAPV